MGLTLLYITSINNVCNNKIYLEGEREGKKKIAKQTNAGRETEMT
jgi:hypothetical protein